MYLFNPEYCLKLDWISLHVCLPLCFVGMNPEYCSFALHVCDSDVVRELNKDRNVEVKTET